MNKKDFGLYKKKMIKKFESIIQFKEVGEVDEQGLPSYTNPNPIMRWLVWERIWRTISIINSLGPIQNVLDYGCGYGVFHPFIIEKSEKLVAYDLMIEDLQSINLKIPNNVEKKIIYEKNFSVISERKKGFNLIIASEVLEHVDDLNYLRDVFYEILEDNGFIVITGPTENEIYKFGRRLAGYTGDYHVRNVYQIRDIMKEKFKIIKTNTMYPIFPIYELYLCTKK